MPEKNLNFKIRDHLRIFRRSLIYQTKEFFQNSTLHGVRYIAETGRPIGEKFMWFCFTLIGTITALVIIMSLWEKFQTNPTITGLDTDFHNQNVVFPTTVICPDISFDHERAYEFVYRHLSNNDLSESNLITPFVELLTQLSFRNIDDAQNLLQMMDKVSDEKTLREWAFEAHASCEDTLLQCKYRDEYVQCCNYFDPVYTEHGFCFAFNSRFKSTANEDVKVTTTHDLYETDKKWALYFLPNGTAKIFIFSNEEYFGADFNAQIEWIEGQNAEVRISKKNTYTTDDARQLTIGQRKCIFYDEVKLQYFQEEYTFSSCMKECRMKKAIKFCKCNPPFYKPISNVRMCTLSDFACLSKHKTNITNIKNCLQCELSCSKTVFNIEKLIKTDQPNYGVVVEFLTWPIIRYKREVLFGWVDLLVSFGGIASLFLGFSLLSGVEIIYYFSLRACCMVYRNRKELVEIEERIKKEPPPLIELSMKPKRQISRTIPTFNDHDTNIRNNLNNNLNEKTLNLDKRNNLPLNVPLGNEFITRRRLEKEYDHYPRTFYKRVKVVPQYSGQPPWEYGQYIP